LAVGLLLSPSEVAVVNNLIWLVGAVVIIIAILSFLGLR